MKPVIIIELIRYFFLTRPYSWFSVAFVPILASVFVIGHVSQMLFLDVLFGLLIWISANLFAERLSRDMSERGKINLLLPILIFLVVIIITVFRNPYALGFLVVILVALFCYSKKNRFWLFGKLSFFIRGVMEAALFLMILFFYNFNFMGAQWIILLLTIYLVTCGRNLIGDIRDVDFDKQTLPTFIGKRLSKLLVLVFYLIPLVLLGVYSVPLIMGIIFIIFMQDYYNLHRILVLINIFLLFELAIVWSGGDWLILTAFLLLGVLLNLSYNLVPRNSNKCYTKRL
jgi:hypothetical protein